MSSGKLHIFRIYLIGFMYVHIIVELCLGEKYRKMEEVNHKKIAIDGAFMHLYISIYIHPPKSTYNLTYIVPN